MSYINYPTTKKTLGAIYEKHQTTFRVWAPPQSQMSVALYEHSKHLHRVLHPMEKGIDGVFSVTISGDFHGYFYTFIIDSHLEVTDPYCHSCNANGVRSAIIDLEKTNPIGWHEHSRPLPAPRCDAILYEVHVRDFTGHATSGARLKGKYLGFVESGTHFEDYTTGIDHLVELGITHVHLLPVYDFLTVDETYESDENYNWGYDPEHFNAPEGSYATNASDPVSRIKELKSLIMALHERGLKVVLDVVYNHTYRTTDSNFHTLVPNYYHRTTKEGYFSNGSGCGNEFASDHAMGRKFIIDSLLYWANEYKVDGFRFDLMALIDQETIIAARKALNEINPDILIYGEPWIGGLSVLPDNKRVYKGAQCNKDYAVFNDDFRNAIKGDNDGNGKGFVQGNRDEMHDTMVGILGSIQYDHSLIGFTTHPSETINYFNAHDNLIITDKFKKSNPDASEETLIRLNKLAFGILMTSQGIPFFHAGNEFLRDKQGHHNSYNLPLSINAIDWSYKEKYNAFYQYVKDLIQLRKQYKSLRLDETKAIRDHILLYDDASMHGAIGYSINHIDENDVDCLFIVHNPFHEAIMLSIENLVKHVCCKPKPNMKKFICNVELHHIFDEDGLVATPPRIDTAHHHILKLNPISTNVFTLKNHNTK